MVLNKNAGEVERLMRDGQAAAKRGDKAMSRILLTQLLELEPNNEQAWMWLSGAVTDLTEQQTCLENVLIINPSNEQARKGLDYIRAKSGRATSVAFDRLTGPLSTKDLPAQSPSVSHTTTDTLSMQPGIGAAPIDKPKTAVLPTQQAPVADSGPTTTDEHSFSASADFTPMAASQSDLPDFMKKSSSFGDNFAPIDGVMPFQAPDDPTPPVYNGGPPAEGTPPDTSKAVPDWVRNTSTQGTATQGTASIDEMLNGHQTAELPPTTNAYSNGNGNIMAPSQAQVSFGQDVDLDAWLDDLAASSTHYAEHPQTEVSTAHLPTPTTEQLAPQSPFPMDPFSNPGAGNFPPVGPFTAAQLPSPEDLPGGHSSDPDQPWYLQASNDFIAAPPEEAMSVPYPVDGAREAYSNNAAPVATIECPNCQHNVPETSLVCSQCQYTFFVHCPHCHELVDTSSAKSGEIEPCPYCGVDINKMELGRINVIVTGALEIPEADPKETEKSWVGEGLTKPTQRRGFLLTFSWLVDLVWLMLIVLMVWALTQLPTWWHLTNLYH